MLSCLMKEAKLACLKKRGRMPTASACGSHTTKLFPAPPGAHDTTASVAASATISYVFDTNGAGIGGPSTGRGSTTAGPDSGSAAHGSGFGSRFTAAAARAIASPPSPIPSPPPLARVVPGSEPPLPLGLRASGDEEEEEAAIWLRSGRCGVRCWGFGILNKRKRPAANGLFVIVQRMKIEKFEKELDHT